LIVERIQKRKGERVSGHQYEQLGEKKFLDNFLSQEAREKEGKKYEISEGF